MVSTHLKNISQIGSFPKVGVKIKNVWATYSKNLWSLWYLYIKYPHLSHRRMLSSFSPTNVQRLPRVSKFFFPFCWVWVGTNDNHAGSENSVPLTNFERELPRDNMSTRVLKHGERGDVHPQWACRHCSMMHWLLKTKYCWVLPCHHHILSDRFLVFPNEIYKAMCRKFTQIHSKSASI